MAVSDWNTTAGNNTSIDGVNIAEGCAASNVNNALRSIMAAVRLVLTDWGLGLLATGNSTAARAYIGAPDALPSGCVLHFAALTPPNGFLACDGAAISRTTYAALFAVVSTTYGTGDGSTTFNLPDLRGEFVRGLDSGRGIDAGRGIGTPQGDAIRNITGTLDANVNDGGADKTGAFYDTGTLFVGSDGGSTSPGGVVGFDASRVVPTASENRPRNVALLACIKT